MANQLDNIRLMDKVIKQGRGFDWILVASFTQDQAKFWQHRLEKLKGKIIGKNAKILSLVEDWEDGAGQLLGTLYAFEKGNRQIDLKKELKAGKKISIYHTSGLGKRTAPLSISQEEGKSAIKLPRLIEIGRKNVPRDSLRLLEATIFSTQIFAPSREGRLSVFWGDQIVIPDVSPQMKERCQIEIFGIKKAIPTNGKVWKKEWQSYGILALNKNQEFLQREKISWPEFKNLKKDLELKELQKSLGFFSVSLEFLKAVLKEFKTELRKKQGKLFTDLHLWIPLSSSKAEYVKQGGNKIHWQRIAEFKQKFLKKAKQPSLIRTGDIGENGFWWDFGQVTFYWENLLKTLNSDLEGKCLRKFFNLEKFWQRGRRNSILVNSKVQGKVQNSLVFNSNIKNLDTERCILFDVETPELFARSGLGYNLEDSKKIILEKEDVLTDIFSKLGKIRIKTKLFRDGKKDWEKKILGNHLSYERLAQLIS